MGKNKSRRKLTYNELYNLFDSRMNALESDLKFTRSWISSVEHMCKWIIDFFFSKRKVNKFMKYVEDKKNEIKKGGAHNN